MQVYPQSSPPALTMLNNDVVARVKLAGPGPLTVPAGGELLAVCKVSSYEPLEDSILMIETPSGALPAGVLMPPCMLLSSEMDKNRFSLFLKN